jgi:SAM-dependent methyltransferase
MRAIAAAPLLLTLACKPPAEEPVVAAESAARADPAPVVPTAPHDEAAIIERTKQFVEAVDEGDDEKVAPMLADGFMHVIPARFNTAEFLLSRLRARKERGYPRYSDRIYDETKARFYGDTAIVTTTTSATLVRAEGVAPGKSAHTMTLVWSFQGGLWLLTTWNEADAGREMDRISWNRTYREGGAVKLAPNRLMIDAVKGLEPGKALDLGAGQGRNAIYLASQGWDVTAIDFSDEGIARTNEAAKAAALDAKVHAHVADLQTWDFGENQYDLILFIYMGPMPPIDDIRRSLKPGGLVVFEHFAADTSKGQGGAGLRKGHLPKLFEEGFEVLRDDHVVDIADWGNAKVPLVRFVAKKR